ncbi:MAG: malectin domain-containing carbohydrate-binding protein, partial [Pseudomonadota bacterium]
DNGTPTDLTDDRLLYTPEAGFTSTDSFTYTVEDPSGETQSATVSIEEPDILGLPQPPAGTSGYYLEKNGVVKVQFEDIVGNAEGWVFQDGTNGNNPGFEGTGYYYWKDELSDALDRQPDEGNFETTIYIQDPGRYKLFIRSTRDNDDRLDAKNDMWVRVNGDTSAVQTVERPLEIEDGYAKIFGTSAAGGWTYSEEWDDTETDDNPGSVVRLQKGFNTFEFAGRSQGYHIDSFQLVKVSNGNDPDESFTSSPFLTRSDDPRFALNINAAGPAFTAADGTEFVADTFFTGGNTANNGGGAIENTEDDTLYQTERFFPNDFSTGYSIPVANGTYSVSLGFAETFLDSPGQRVFDVLIEDAVVLDDLDIFAEAGAADTAFTADPITVDVLDGVLDIGFVAGVQNPIINAISITDVTSEDVAPIAQSDTADVGFATANIIDVLSNDVDFDGDSLQIVSVGSEATLGTVAIDDNNTPDDTTDDFIVYTSDGSGAGADSFTYEIADSTGRTATGSVNVNVLPLDAVAFDTVSLNGVPNKSWTSLQFGPDDRLYASDRFGEIFAFEIEQVNDPTTGKITGYNVLSTEIITAVLDIPNYNDDGTPAPEVTDRQVTGFVVTGTAENPVIYVGSSDPREGGGGGGGDGDVGLDTNSGIISRLDWDGTDWQKVDLVRGLPRSEENHSINGMILSTDPVTGNDILYVQAGGNTNAGAPSTNFAFASETALSAAILKVDLTVLESGTGDYTVKTDGAQQYVYDLPTVLGDTVGVFGGRDGLNQARLVEGSPVSVYSSGWRNGYDIVETEAGDLFSIDNGANEGWGGLPNGEGTANVTDEQTAIDPDGFNSVNNLDHLEYITGEGYYAGHPNPIRANPNGAGITVTDEFSNEVWVETPGGTWPPVDPVFSFPNDGDFLLPGVEDNALVTWEISTNGLDEYTASTFQGALKGNLITASFNSNIYSVQVDPSKTSATKEVLASNPLGIPLDVTTQGDDDIFAGTIWVGYVAGFNGSGGPEIEVLVPTTATGTPDDFDGDGYLNDDEIANGTNEFNPSSTPADNDGDLVSDLNDDDDDNDLILDVDDHFEWDTNNGTGLVVTDTTGFFNPLRNDDPGFGLGGLGFTGWMTNGVTNYLDTFDDANLILGGTSGIFTILNTSSGDARGALNTQENGFQFGVDLQTTGPVLVKSDQPNVFGSLDVTQLSSGQSTGIYIGSGDQDNYVKLAVGVDGSNTPGIVLLHEEGGVLLEETFMQGVTLQIGAQVELFLEIDATLGTVTPGWRIDGSAGETGESITVGGDVLAAIQGTYQNQGQDSAMAVGVIATSGPTGNDFAANYDVIDVFAGTLADEFSFV